MYLHQSLFWNEIIAEKVSREEVVFKNNYFPYNLKLSLVQAGKSLPKNIAYSMLAVSVSLENFFVSNNFTT